MEKDKKRRSETRAKTVGIRPYLSGNSARDEEADAKAEHGEGKRKNVPSQNIAKLVTNLPAVGMSFCAMKLSIKCPRDQPEIKKNRVITLSVGAHFR